ncbi:Holliday junction resolvase RuvX [Arthrobacter sp. B1805]|uniref:Holliday junction resolvase RuvX n=1 Tax=Arthrobacter sp. B1805 TaxID=2058892 RepID=UPI000CE44462|nr:Holliday junction resolvase RuvX [Arthrobacter sp. B1805]
MSGDDTATPGTPGGTPYPLGPKLGVDVGQVRVGLAGSDRDGLLATPIRTLKRDAKKNSDIRILIREAVERGAVQIIVGLPKQLSGREGASAEMARSYAGLIAGELHRQGLTLSLRLVDERLSTVSAHRSLHSAGLSSRDHRKVVDQVAAVEILQHAIDMQRSRGRDVGDPVPVREAEGDQGPLLTPTEEPVIKDSSSSRRGAES